MWCGLGLGPGFYLGLDLRLGLDLQKTYLTNVIPPAQPQPEFGDCRKQSLGYMLTMGHKHSHNLLYNIYNESVMLIIVILLP